MSTATITMLGTSDVAKLLKLTPRALRVILRSSKIAKTNKDGLYQWSEADAKKLVVAVKSHIAEAEKKPDTTEKK